MKSADRSRIRPAIDAPHTHVTHEFGLYRLDPARRQLTGAEGATIKVTAKVFDALSFLVANPGRLVSRAELTDVLWPHTIVEDNNLNQTIWALRRALDDHAREKAYVATVPGRGYQFVADVRRVVPAAGLAQDSRPAILLEAVAAVEVVVGWAVEALGSIPIVLNDARHRTVLGLFASLLELSDCCVKLARSGGFTGIPVLGRTAIEVYVDLKNLIADAAYLGVLEVAHDKEWARLLEQAVEHENPFVAGLAGLPDVDERRVELQTRIDEAHAAGVPKRMTKEEKFSKAGMSQEYETVYDVLCAAAHSSPSALMSRHIDVRTWPIQFVVGRQDPAWVDSTMSALAELLRSAGYMVAQFAGSLIPPTTALDAALARMYGAFAIQPD